MLKQCIVSDSIVFALATVISIYTISLGYSHLLWLSLLVHIVVTSIFSAVVHRYYSHNVITIDERLMFLFSLIPAAFFYNSPVGWLVLHSAHHANADTEKDTHVKGINAFFFGSYKEPPERFKRLSVRYLRDRKHSILHKYFLLVGIITSIVLFLLSPHVFLYAYALPLFTIHLANKVHLNFSHGDNGAVDRWYMEYILPMGGEWIHKTHHALPKQLKFKTRWFEFDGGYLFLKFIGKL